MKIRVTLFFLMGWLVDIDTTQGEGYFIISFCTLGQVISFEVEKKHCLEFSKKFQELADELEHFYVKG